MSSTRRKFLTRSSWLTASALGLPPLAWAAEPAPTRVGQKPRHIIHLVSDGTSYGTICSADQFSHLARGHALAWLQLYQQPDAYSAFVDMRSLNSLVTDSAAASSSWGSGSRVVNGVLNVLPDGRDLHTLYQLFNECGWTRGLVTTTEITHATPAGFATNSEKRDATETIAVQYLQRKIEVLLGGGQQYFSAKTRKDKRDLIAEYRRHGYAVFQSLNDFNAAPNDGRWLGLFAPNHLPYTLDHLHDAHLLATVPSLAKMTRSALERLRRAEHFILQVEGGRVDHAAHGCDAAAALHDLLAFDDALAVCLEFQRHEPNTLLVVTTDHGTGNPSLNGMGKEYAESCPRLANLLNFTQSFTLLLKQLGTTPSAAQICEAVQGATGYAVPTKKAGLLAKFFEKKGEVLYDSLNSASVQLGQLLANYVGIGWTTSAHTGDYVPLVARGPGAELFRGFIRNTDVFQHYLRLADIDFRNPDVPLLAESGPSAASVEAEPDWLA